MATTSNSLPPGVVTAGGAAGPAQSRVTRWLWPSLFDLVFVSLPLWFFALADGGTGLLLADGDTGWHIRTGEWILDHRAFVHGDLFSFTKPGQQWFAWEWLADVVLGLLHRAWGMPGVVMLGIVAAALFCGLVFRHIVWRGANVFIALPLSLMGFGAATVHLLARPHLFTMVLMAAAAWMIQADIRRPGWKVWLLVPVTVVWTNLHGGWLAVVALAGLTGVGLAVEAWLGEASWASARRYVYLAGACFAASLVNPYGWHLHAHIAQYLQADWIKDMVGEFQSPTFRGENMAQFEVLLLASCAAAGMALLRRKVVGPLLIVFWAHQSLISGRHIPLFVAVAVPFLADELQRLWQAWGLGAGKKSVAGIFRGLAEEAAPGVGRASVWAVIPFILIAVGVIPIPWRDDFPDGRFPVKIVARHAALISASRPFTEDQWADYLIYRFSPQLKVFFDGRSDFYGEKLTREYCRIINGDHDWKELVDRYGFNLVLAKPGWALTALLKESGQWRVVEDNKKAVLFQRIR